jgi:hypothetical protein
MDTELQQELFNQYPLLFADKDLPRSQTSMCYGICCGNGWYPLLSNLCASIEPMIREWQAISDQPDNHPRLAQVKEKFGGFRFYMHDLSPEYMGEELSKEIRNLSVQALKDSYTICEVCGSSGEKRDDLRWIQTLCYKHYTENKRKER